MIRKRPRPDRDSPDVLVVFDLDGTITVRDTSLPFVAHAIGTRRLVGIVATRCPLFPVDLLSGTWRGVVGPTRLGGIWGRWEADMHRRILDGAFRGATREQLAQYGSRFADEVVDGLVISEAVAQLRWHQAQGHRCVLASASLDIYVEPWARRMGFHQTVATRLAFDATDCFQGRFDGEPCWGTEKLLRLRQVEPPFEESTLVVYGDGEGDATLLKAADLPIKIRKPGDWADLAARVRRAL